MILKYQRITKESESSVSFKIDDQTKILSIPKSQVCSAVRDDRDWVEIGFMFAHHNGLERFIRPIQDKPRGSTIWLRFEQCQEKPKATRFWFSDGAKVHIPNKHIKELRPYHAEVDTKWAIKDRLTYYETEAPCQKP